MNESTIVIPRRFCGPAASGNGGYVCGRLAAFVDAEAVEVTLRLPPPLDRPLRVTEQQKHVRLLDGELLIAEAVAADLDLEAPAPVPWDVAVAASAGYAGFEEHAFPECFVCGPAREPGDGLRIFAGPVAGVSGVVAAPWVAREGAPEIVWAAIDCPGAFAVGFSARGETVLGRMTARVLALPAAGERCVAVGWPIGEEGRKLYAGTALFSEVGDLLACARQTWIVPLG
ncbi:MAG: hypothetical protein ABI927_00385 [Gaiellaceae bacterium]